MTRQFDPDPAPAQWEAALSNLVLKSGEYKGPCPLCGGTDRFHVRDGDIPGKVLAKCRQCEAPYPDLKAAVFPSDELKATRKRRPNGARRPKAPKAKPTGERATWHYFNADGSLYATITRVEHDDGSKAYFPDPKGLTPPHPLYQLPDLIERTADPVLIVEGEKAADAAQRTVPGYTVTTSMGGCKRAAETDWTPLTGRDVVIWPDADKPGTAYAWHVNELALSAGARDVRVIRLPGGLPDGFDLGDTLPDGFDVKAVMETRNVRGLPGLLPIVEFMELENAVRNWLVSDLLPTDGVAMIASQPKFGKSTVARCLSVAVADPNCTEFLGHAVTAGPVLYVNLEERRGTAKAHYEQIGFPKNITIFHGQAVDIAPDFPERMALLNLTVSELRPALVIIDTMGKFCGMARDELNDYSAVTAYMEPFLAIARKHRNCILLLHHTRKGGGDFGSDVLGSGALTASMDTTISLTREGDRRQFTVTGRDGVETDSPIVVSLTDGWVNAEGTRAEVARDATRAKVWTVLRAAHPEWTPRNDVIAAAKPAAQKTVLDALAELTHCGDVETTGRGVSGDPKKYRANPERI